MAISPRLKSFVLRSREAIRVVYIIYGDGMCIFTAIRSRFGPSSINAAEDIIQAIASIERIDPLKPRWFDLQTHRMYHKAPGEFEYDELELDGQPAGSQPDSRSPGDRIHVRHWYRDECPPDIIELFAQYIGPNPYQQKHSDDHRPDVVKRIVDALHAEPLPEFPKDDEIL